MDMQIQIKPRLIALELTRACNLACKHCRASAITQPESRELSTSEVENLIESIAIFCKPVIILTGGEPLLRSDVFDIARFITARGLSAALATNATLVTPEFAVEIKQSGIERVSVSIDGASEKTHDEFRNAKGAFAASMQGIKNLQLAGVSVQINTTITKHNIAELQNILELAKQLKVQALHIFMLVPTGRGREIEGEEVSPEQYEQVLNWFYHAQIAETNISFKATCAPHYYRIMHQKGLKKAEQKSPLERVTKGCLAATGFCFISSTGDVQPCGYLPLIVGNIRDKPFAEIWFNSREFRELRDPEKLKGKCGRCEFKRVCGGCRARAYARYGDYLEEEPYCIYQPKH